MAVIGIDLGTTNSIAVAYRNGKVELIPNIFGEFMTPSVVSLNEDKVIVGKIAKEKLISDPNNTTSLFKRNMGTNKKVKLGNQSFLPEELSALVVKQLVADAEMYLKEKVEELVISVPAYFNAKQRKATKLIGKYLGIKVKRLINEPSAAAITCHQDTDFETFIVFDFGGGTLDVTVVDCFENVISICSIAGNNHLGGSDFDKSIALYFCQMNNLNYNELSRQDRESILMSAERLKLYMQTQHHKKMKLSIQGKIYECDFNKELLKNIFFPILNQVKEVISQAVKDCNVSVNEIDRFIMVGGSSNMPIVQEYLYNLLKIPVEYVNDIDLVVAQGLGKYVGIKKRESEMKDIVVTDICPFSLSTAVFNENDPKKPISEVIISRNTVLPVSRTIELHALEINQKKVNVGIYQGESLYVKDNIFLGMVEVDLPKNSNQIERIKLTYSYDINNMLYIEIIVLSTNQSYLYKMGGANLLERVKSSKHLEKIKKISLQLHQEPEYEACLEKAERIFKELDVNYHYEFKKQIDIFISRFKQNSNNINNKQKIIVEMNSLLDEYDTGIEFMKSAIFIDDDNSGSLLS